MTFTGKIHPATDLVAEVYSHFLEAVVEGYVAKERIGGLSEKSRKKVEAGKNADVRFVRLMTLSGKGGYSEDPDENAKRSRYANVTLLDHLLSVGRGAMMFYALECLQQNPGMDQEILKSRLAALAALGFMHDADKIAGLPRSQALTPSLIDDLCTTYGVSAFCRAYGIELSPAQWLGLIEKVEGTQAHRHKESQPPPRDLAALPLFVGFADKLDGAWLLDDPQKGGLAGVKKRLETDRSVDADVFRQWKALELLDPHHPFLLDELQRWISFHCLHQAGLPPLIETHQDGRLFMLLPEKGYDAVLRKGLDSLKGKLPFGLDLDVSNRGMPSLLNARPTMGELSRFVLEDMSEKKISTLFQVKFDIAAQIHDDLGRLLEEVDVAANIPNKSQGLSSLFSTLEKLEDQEKLWVRKAALLTLLLNLKVDAPAKAGVPDYDAREKALLDLMESIPPGWISKIQNGHSRRVLLALWACVLSEDEDDLGRKIFSDEGLLKTWLEGSDEIPGFSYFISEGGGKILEGLESRFSALLNKNRIQGADLQAKGRCLFTGEPMDFSDSIAQADGLYEVKVSAFSGRDNRPESVSMQKAHTNVSPVSKAEHRIRTDVHSQLGGRAGGVPSLVSSPATLGLFGGLAVTNDKALPGFSIYDLSREDLSKGKVLKGCEIFSNRHRIARFERMPEKTVDQLDVMRLLLKAALRTGRPIHVFRGLPLRQKAFFYYDAMPRVCQDLLGGKSLRIEQILPALEKLEVARAIGETHGLGYDVLTLYAGRSTRFQAVCLSCGVFRDKEENLRTAVILKSQFEEYMKGALKMTDQDEALVELGRKAATIQEWPRKGSNNEERMVFNLCMDTVIGLTSIGQDARQTLIFGVAGELENNLEKRNKGLSHNQERQKDRCLMTAEWFVDKVWFEALKGKIPTQKAKRLMCEVYRMSFLYTHKENFEQRKNKSEESQQMEDK
ncbi:hypothetical protein [Desulfatibacillum aliphaticivorans]|uniref:hypothetical protein n=1 Tax=Desulfatibacillum aliphaticivorans TaxID=218208 RepID=UPI00041FFE96|nr:hypothetical protein [Desulfatibacillum aliphaticivorans]